MACTGSRLILLHLFLQTFFLTLSLGINGLLDNKCVTSIKDAALKKYNYKSFVMQDMFACYYKCKEDKLCQSLNFYTEKNLCELNNRTRAVGYGNFISNAGAIYLDSPFRAFLGSSPLLPASSCREIKDSSEGLAPSDRYWFNSGGPGNPPVSAYCDMDNAVIVQCTGNPCQNGGSCEYQGEGQYSCRCRPGYSGDHCETDVNECSSNPCLNGATCTNILNAFTCACPAYFTGMRCEHGLGPECNNYTLDKEADRSVTHATVGSSYKCDSALATGWYRFNGTAGTKMPTSCVSSNMCNTHATGWLNGAHPTPQEGIVNRNVCFNWSGNCCNWMVVINVRNCGLFYVYKLVKTSNCQLRYCVTK